MQIDGRTYSKPGAYVPGGDPGIRYARIDTKANIEAELPAAEYPGILAYATDQGSEIISDGVNWVALKATDFALIDNIKFPTTKAVNDQITARALDFAAAAGVESFTFRVIEANAVGVGGLQPVTFRFPYNFTITEVRAYIDAIGNQSNQYVELLKNNVLMFVQGGPGGTQLMWVEDGNLSSQENTVHPVQPPITPGMETCLSDDKITVTTAPGATTKGLSIVIIGTKTP